MGRVAKKPAESALKEKETSPLQTITSGRAKRTPKPNPKYANDSIVLVPKAISESSESNTPIASDTEDKLADVKVVKSTKKVVGKKEETPIASAKKPTLKGKAAIAKKQKLEYDDEEEPKTEDLEKPTRSMRSKGGVEAKTESPGKGEIKVGEESVAIIDVSSIISKIPAESSKNLRTPVRKRGGVVDEPVKEDIVKKKKDDEKPSLITARKSYLPVKPVIEEESKIGDVATKEEEKEDDLIEEESAIVVSKTPASTMKTRRTAVVSSPSQSVEPVDKKPKIEDLKTVKTLPVVKKDPVVLSPSSVVTSPKQVETRQIGALPTKVISNINKPVPRILNTMITPRAKQSPVIKLAGDGSDKKVFSIDLTEDASRESVKKAPIVISPVKASPLAVKENISNNKTQPAMLLKNKLESELNRMKASANIYKRQIISNPTGRQSLTMNSSPGIIQSGARRITKFESWYVIDVKNVEHTPYRHTHTFSLIQLGNNIKDLQLPSANWDHKVTLQRRQSKKGNNNEGDDEQEEEEIYTGDVMDKSIESEKHNFEPSSILFKRSHRVYNKVSIDRSLMLKQNMYTITMEGKQCKLIGAPDDIKSLEDLEILLKIIDSSNLQHSCVELVTNHDIINIS